MQQLTFEWVVASLALAVFMAGFFRSFRCYGVLGFVFAWNCFTPVRPWYIDMPMLLVSIGLVEIIFRLMNRK